MSVEVPHRGEVVSREIHLPGFRLGRNLSDWLAIPKDSPGRTEYANAIAEVEQAERKAAQVGESVLIRGSSIGRRKAA